MRYMGAAGRHHMQLTRFTDYVLRTLLYLGTHPGEVVPASAISEAFDISPDHLAKAAKWLAQHGYVRGARGAGGGLTLARELNHVTVGELVRATEPHAGVLECFDDDTNACRLASACRLKGVLGEATRAFYAVLDGYTLADLLQNREQLLQLLPRRGAAGKAPLVSRRAP